MSDFPFQLPYVRWADYAHIRTSLPPRRLYDHEFVYVVSGCGNFQIHDQQIRATPDTLLLMPPRVWHSWQAESNAPMLLIGIHFDWTPRHDVLHFSVHRPVSERAEKELFREPQAVPYWNSQSTPGLPLTGRPRVRQLFERIIEEHRNTDEEVAYICGALLAAAILQVSREARQLRQRHRSTRLGADAERRLQRARELLDSPHNPPLSVEEVATQVDWSADHLRRLFRDVFNTSPIKLQTAARVRHAKELLRASELSAGEVAERCGFADASHFTRVFRRESGLTPRQFLVLAKRR